MNVLSVFDGISCGQVALKRANIKYKNYFSSEINPNAIKETMANFPNTIQVGDIKKVKKANLPPINLLMGGSPCQGFSYAGKRLNFNDSRSRLFFEFVRLLKEINPPYFLLENVKMKPEYQKVISDYLGVEPIEINSSLVSAQNRVRLYWTNICIPPIIDKGITLQNVLDNSKMPNKASIVGRRINKDGIRKDYDKKLPLYQYLEVRPVNRDKSACLTTVAKDTVLTSLPCGRYKDVFNQNLPFRYFSIKECCKLQTLPINYFKCSSESQARKLIGNAWTIDVIAHILKNMTPKQYSLI